MVRRYKTLSSFVLYHLGVIDSITHKDPNIELESLKNQMYRYMMGYVKEKEDAITLIENNVVGYISIIKQPLPGNLLDSRRKRRIEESITQLDVIRSELNGIVSNVKAEQEVCVNGCKVAAMNYLRGYYKGEKQEIDIEFESMSRELEKRSNNLIDCIRERKVIEYERSQ